MAGGSTNTRIQFTAQGLQDIKTSAISLLREMVSLNENYNKSTKDSLDLLKEQIDLLEKRNSLLSVSAQPIPVTPINGISPSGGGSSGIGDSQSIVNAINIFKDEQQLDNSSLVSEVQNILDFLKTSLNGTVPPPSNPPDPNPPDPNNQNTRTTEERGGGNRSSFQWTKDIYNLMNLANEAFKADDYAKTYTKGGQALGSSLMGSFAGFGAIAGVPLMLASMGSETLLDLYDKKQKALRGSHQLFGGINEFGQRPSLSEFGFSYLDSEEEKQRVSRSLGRQASDKEVTESVIWQGAGVDSNLTDSLFKLQRSSPNKDRTVSEIVNAVTQSQKLNGDWSLLDEHLQILVGLSEQQLSEYGQTNVILNNQILSTLAGLSEDFKNPQVLQQVFSKVMDGTQNAKTPQFEALQYRTMDQLLLSKGKKMSMWEMTKIMKDPNHEYFGEFMTSLMNNTYQQTGGQNFEMILQSQYGLSISQIRDLSKAMVDSKGNLTLEEYTKASSSSSTEALTRAKNSTPSLDQRMAEFSDLKLGTLGDNLDKSATAIVDSMQTLNGIIFDLSGTLGSFIDTVKKELKKRKVKGF